MIPMSENEVTAGVGQKAPDFSLPSIQGDTISLDDYRDRRNILLWFSRGFTCNFCRGQMENIASAYDMLMENGVEVIQIAPNLTETAQRYFEPKMPRHPFICDPDKRLFGVYDLGDAGSLEATRNAVVSFSTSFMTGVGKETVRASWIDVMNRNFIRRLHHHALTAVAQGLFIIDKESIIRYRLVISPVERIPNAPELMSLVTALCPT
jgi:peroxiredoxin